MNSNTLFNKQYQTQYADEVLKATSLIYLKDALVSERYEEAAELISAAKDFGAQKAEVRQVINEYLREAKNGRLGRTSLSAPGRRY